MKQEQIPRNPARGLCLIAQIEKQYYFKTINDAFKYRVVHHSYPFKTPFKMGMKDRDIHFVGAGATDITIESFIVNLRSHLGYTSECKPQVLRVISAPFEGGDREQKVVFFEVWFEMTIVISGETNNFSGAGNAARNELEDLFDALSKIYNIDIERLELPQTVPSALLYRSGVYA